MIEFYFEAEPHIQKNGLTHLAVMERFHFWTGRKVVNGSGHVIDPGERWGLVDADIIKENAEAYNAWRLEVDKNENKYWEAARADYLAKHGGLK